MRVGLIASVGEMLDAFFPEIVEVWEDEGFIVFPAAGTVSALLPSAVVIPGLTRRPGIGLARARRHIRRWARQQRLDVIVTNSATASAVVRAAGLETPIVYFCHGLHWNYVRSARELVWYSIERVLAKRSAGVITINSYDAAFFNELLPSNRILRLTAGVGLDLKRYPRSSPPGAGQDGYGIGSLKLSWIGEFSRRKRPWLALAVVRELLRAGINVQLTMLGSGDLLPAIREDIENSGLRGSVIAPGHGNALRALEDSHALLHTASWEGLPRVMLEASAVGRRTYAFDVKGVNDVPGAELVSDRDFAALARMIADRWSTGELLDPPEVDRRVLSSIPVARSIVSFLQQLADDGSPRTSETNGGRSDLSHFSKKQPSRGIQ